MHEPHFWRVRDLRSRASAPMLRLCLTPAEALYRALGRRRILKASPERVAARVVCIGALTLGGAGKSPVAAAIRAELTARGCRAATLSRGYGGRMKGPVRVETGRHSAEDAGDEPVMLSADGEAWVSRNRTRGAHAMCADGVGVIVLDDGHQNPDLAKDISVVVIDVSDPFGNGFVFPKGPLRERPEDGLRRADAVILMGDGEPPPALQAFAGPVLRARLEPLAPVPPGRYVAFAGIARPQRFFDSLASAPGVSVAEATSFPDHHAFTVSDIRELDRLAAAYDARLITTRKDHVRLAPDVRARIAYVPVTARFSDPAALERLIGAILGDNHG